MTKEKILFEMIIDPAQGNSYTKALQFSILKYE